MIKIADKNIKELKSGYEQWYIDRGSENDYKKIYDMVVKEMDNNLGELSSPIDKENYMWRIYGMVLRGTREFNPEFS